MSVFPNQITEALIQAVRGFTLRSAKRDAEIDEARIAAAEASLEAIVADLCKEKSGLVERVKALLKGPPMRLSASGQPVQTSTSAQFAHAEARIASLDKQIRQFEQARATVAGIRCTTRQTT